MGYPVDLERVHGGIANKYRRVDKRVEVGSAIVMRCPTGRCGETRDRGLPYLREDQVHVMGTGDILAQGQKRGSAVQESEAVLNPVRAYGHLTTVDTIRDHDCLGIVGVNTPAVLARFVQAEPSAIRSARHEAFDVASILTYQVRARRPHGHGQLNPGFSTCGKRRFHFDVVRMRGRETERIAYGLKQLGHNGSRHRHGLSHEPTKTRTGVAPIGSACRPRSTTLSLYGGCSVSRRRVLNRSRRPVKARRASVRANGAPRQWCTPRPKERWLASLRVMSNCSGAWNTSGSWLAAPSSSIMPWPLMIRCPPISTSSSAVRKSTCTAVS